MNSPKDELTALLALNRIDRIGSIRAKYLYEQLGSAQEIFRNRKHLNEIITGVNQSLINALDDSGVFIKAEEELQFIEENHIRCLTPEHQDYPSRLRDCEDAPLLLFTLGNADLNTTKIVSVVGTRKATEYGRRMCNRLIEELHTLCPDILIVSGLAYGIDAISHKAALDNNCKTVGVLAHGLDMIYPRTNRDMAKRMLDCGGLVTEFMSQTIPLPNNFLRRNRIVAGLADAVVIVESAARGGSLATADMAQSYHRDCFAFPGSVGDIYSEGCNALIRDNKAALITSGSDLVDAMGWGTKGVGKSEPIQTELQFDLTPQEQQVFDKVREKAQGVHINTLVVECNMPYALITSVLFSLEMKELVKPFPGSMYKPLV
ncbi:MAG: DNA-processing protein DprA [Bacteroidaceae bacterium]|nr:DNA-processing protein DprA [Bacteroidaceae bacterium]